MTILIAPDKFKGSLDAAGVCAAIEQGLRESGVNFNSLVVPMADGGEGTCDVLTRVSQGRKISVQVCDPLFRSIDAVYGLSGDGTTAFIEMAAASGLQLLKTEERNPLATTTYGTGQLIADALRRDVRTIILGIGGSATNDAGMGMATALGARFFSTQGEVLRPVGKDLIGIQTVDTTQLHPRLKNVSFVALCDVNNPFYGTHGAAYVFAPQKGADATMVSALDNGLRNFAEVVQRQFDMDLDFPGAGAGGGLAGGASVFLNIRFQPGIAFLMDYTGLEEKVKQSDLVITGEGKVDEQTLSGKVVNGVAGLAKKYKKPLYVVAGKNTLPRDTVEGLGIRRIITVQSGELAERDAMNNAFALLKQRICEELAPLLA
jgi:glycerate kinase